MMNIGALLKEVQDKRARKDVPEFRVGDTIRVNIRIKEGDKIRVQPFEGVVIARRGSGLSAKFCVRRISYSIGVEKTFPIHSPLWESIRVLRASVVKRAKLRYFFQDPNRDMRFKEDPRRQAAAAPPEAVRVAKPKVAAPEPGDKKLSAEKVAKLKERRAKKKDKRVSRRELVSTRAAKGPGPEPVAAAAAPAAVKAEEKKE